MSSSGASDPFVLDRFVQAQEGVIADVRRELGAGRKRTHWMWFVFPQLRALGRSAIAQHYGIASLAEARAYAGQAVLGPRLIECAGLVLAIQGRSAAEIFGSPDDVKLLSSMTLFAAAAPGVGVFDAVIRRYYGGTPDALTLALLRGVA